MRIHSLPCPSNGEGHMHEAHVAKLQTLLFVAIHYPADLDKLRREASRGDGMPRPQYIYIYIHLCIYVHRCAQTHICVP